MGFIYLDTGAMYRAVALAAKQKGVDFNNGTGLGKVCETLDLWFDRGEEPPRLMLGQEDISSQIRSPEMDMLSSAVSAVREVRDAMASLQRKMAEGADLVAEGRDMGTVVFPGARWKFYLTASAETRALRRYRERQARGESVTEARVAEDLEKRDRKDQFRALSPLKPAGDATIIDSTLSTVEEVVQEMLEHIERERTDQIV